MVVALANRPAPAGVLRTIGVADGVPADPWWSIAITAAHGGARSVVCVSSSRANQSELRELGGPGIRWTGVGNYRLLHEGGWSMSSAATSGGTEAAGPCWLIDLDSVQARWNERLGPSGRGRRGRTLLAPSGPLPCAEPSARPGPTVGPPTGGTSFAVSGSGDRRRTGALTLARADFRELGGSGREESTARTMGATVGFSIYPVGRPGKRRNVLLARADAAGCWADKSRSLGPGLPGGARVGQPRLNLRAPGLRTWSEPTCPDRAQSPGQTTAIKRPGPCFCGRRHSLARAQLGATPLSKTRSRSRAPFHPGGAMAETWLELTEAQSDLTPEVRPQTPAGGPCRDGRPGPPRCRCRYWNRVAQRGWVTAVPPDPARGGGGGVGWTNNLLAWQDILIFVLCYVGFGKRHNRRLFTACSPTAASRTGPRGFRATARHPGPPRPPKGR